MFKNEIIGILLGVLGVICAHKAKIDPYLFFTIVFMTLSLNYFLLND